MVTYFNDNFFMCVFLNVCMNQENKSTRKEDKFCVRGKLKDKLES